MNNSKEFLGTEPIGKLLFKLAVPLSSRRSSTCCINIVDRIYIDISREGSLA